MFPHRPWLCRIALHLWVRIPCGLQASLQCEECGKEVKYDRFLAVITCFLFGHAPTDPDCLSHCRCCSKFV